MPGPLALVVLGAGNFAAYSRMRPRDVLQHHEILELLGIDAILVVDGAIGIGHGDDLGAPLDQLLDRVLRHVARSGDGAHLALQRIVAGFQHLFGEVDCAVPRRFGPHQRAAPASACP